MHSIRIALPIASLGCWRQALALLITCLAFSMPASGSIGKCQPCTGLTVESPIATAELLGELPALKEKDVLYLRWTFDVGSGALPDSSVFERASAAGATSWVAVLFDSPAPLAQNLETLSAELEELATLAGRAPANTFFELRWRGASKPSASEESFFIKRAAVAISGAQPASRVLFALDNDELGHVEALYAEEIAPYLDGLAISPDTDPRPLAKALESLDPGSDLAIVDLPIPSSPLATLPALARATEAGASIALFQSSASESELLAPLTLIAREFSGDVVFDPYSSAAGAETWAFVHGTDLSLRIIVERPSDSPRVTLDFSSRQLTAPAIMDPSSPEADPVYGGSRTRRGYRLELDDAPEAFVLKLERPAAGALAGVEGVREQVVVEDVRTMPVGEILRRLQAFEDAHARRLENYTATSSSSLRYQIGGVQSIDVTYRGPFFFRRGEPTDWVWQEFLVNGIRWRGKKIPEIPLIQPEKASALPLEINFSRDYSYRLRGTARVVGRDCWVVDFEPNIRPEPGRSLFQGTVWIDRQLFARVRTRAVQLGLQGEVLSNEETITYSAIDRLGEPAPWNASSFFLPLRLVGQQQLSLLDATILLEREVTLSHIEINSEDFVERRQAQFESDYTMVRDTDQGLRYLVPDQETGERVVQEEIDPTRLFLVGGVFYDKSLDFPLPLAGINWFSYDFRGTGTQVNAFFAGPLLTLDIASPSLFGSRFTGGLDFAALAIATTDSIFRGDREAEEEDVESLRPNIDATIGRPLGNHFKLDFEYSLGWNSFDRGDDTAESFVIPEDHLSHSFTLAGRYDRKGYRTRVALSHVIRTDWEPWGLPGNTEFDPDQESYSKWGGSISKIWHLPLFQKVGAEVEYVGGQHLDRFSKYEFGFFSGIRVHGYRSDRVRAEEAYAAHLSYGFGLGEFFRLDVVGDAAWATDEASGLRDELLGGVGIVGTLTGPWNTLFNVDVGVPVTGPDNGLSAFIAVLKLFR